MSAQDFSQKQHRDLEVFVSGVQTRRASQGLKRLGADLGPPTGPDRAHLAAMVHVEALGKELRKFNVGCDGGGATPVLEDANDIAFTALRAGHVEPALIDRSAKGAPMSQAAARDFMAELNAVGHAQADVY